MAAETTKNSPPEMSGFLLKWTNYLKGYQRRYFVLTNGVLSYYRYTLLLDTPVVMSWFCPLLFWGKTNTPAPTPTLLHKIIRADHLISLGMYSTEHCANQRNQHLIGCLSDPKCIKIPRDV